VSKKAIIITDGTESINSIAKLISGELTGFNIKIIPSDQFVGTDLLPVDTFFIGCENAKPASFAYLEEMLSHINLASRTCRIFSVNEKALKYLDNIVKDCEADTTEGLLALNGEVNNTALKSWLKVLIEESTTPQHE